MPDPTGTAEDTFLYDLRSLSRRGYLVRAAERRALAQRVHHATADSKAALRRADTALADSHQLMEATRRRLAPSVRPSVRPVPRKRRASSPRQTHRRDLRSPGSE